MLVPMLPQRYKHLGCALQKQPAENMAGKINQTVKYSDVRMVLGHSICKHWPNITLV